MACSISGVGVSCRWHGAALLSVTRYELEFEDTFDADVLDERRWAPHYLPQWSSRERSAARYEVGGGRLRRMSRNSKPAFGLL